MRCLLISTVAQSLRFQSPAMWRVLRDRGAELTFAAGSDGWERELLKFGAFIELPIDRYIGSLTPRAIWAFRELLSASWDYVQVQSPLAAGIARAVVPRERPYALAYVAHGFHFDPDRLSIKTLPFESLERVLASRGEMVALVAAADYEYCSRSPISRRVATWHLPGAGIDTAEFARATRDEEKAEERLRVLFCGELNNNKDPLTAVEAVALTATRRPVALTVVGSGHLKPIVLAQVDSLSARGVPATLVEYADDMPAMMARNDVLIAPSYREGVPRVVVEALAAGVPVIARSNRGSRELLAGGLGSILPRTAGGREFAQSLGAFRRGEFPSMSIMRGRAEGYSVEVFARSYSQMLDVLGVSSGVRS